MSNEKRWTAKGTTGASVLALALAGALALPSTAAFAQAAATPDAAPAAPAAPVYYKNKGPGGNNSYAFRYEEDFSFLRDPSKSTDFFDPMKFIAFDDAKQFYVTFSALERLRYDNIQNNTYNLGNNVKAHQAEDYSRRTQVGADVHLGPNFRIYAELLNAASSGRNVSGLTGSPPTAGVGRVGANGGATSWRNDLALQQAFIEGMADVNILGTPGKVGIRAGRQGLYLGNGLAVAFPATANVISMPDGVRAYVDTGHDRIDAFFGVNTLRDNTGLIQDRDNWHENFGILYGSHDFPTINLLGADAHITDDPFLIHMHNAGGGTTNAAFPGAATRTLNTGGYGNSGAGLLQIVGTQEEYTLGDRLFGDVGNFDFDWTGQLQKGSMAGYEIDAFAVYTDWGYTLRDLPWKPRVGTHIDIASGGGDRNAKVTHLFDQQFIRQPYIGEVVNTAPTLTNLYDFAPRIKISPTSSFSAEFSWTFDFRYSSADGVYGPQGPYNSAPLTGTTTTRGNYIGSQPNLDLRWTPIAHVAFDAEIGEQTAGSVIKNAGGTNETYGFVQVTLQF